MIWLVRHAISNHPKYVYFIFPCCSEMSKVCKMPYNGYMIVEESHSFVPSNIRVYPMQNSNIKLGPTTSL